MSDPVKPLSILKNQDNSITVLIGDPKAPEQHLTLPQQTWWLIMGHLTKVESKQTP